MSEQIFTSQEFAELPVSQLELHKFTLDSEGKVAVRVLGGAAGNMLSSVYDPGNIGANAFAMENMIEAADAKIMTAAERTKLSNALIVDDIDDTLAALDKLWSSTKIQNELNALDAAKLNISDIVDNLTSLDTNKALSANQGKLLKDMIDAINTLLTSDDTTLDELQEIVDYIKANKSVLDNLAISNIAGLQAALDGKASLAGGNTITGAQIFQETSDNTAISVRNSGGLERVGIKTNASNGGYVVVKNTSNVDTIALRGSGESYLNGGNVGIGVTSGLLEKLDISANLMVRGSNVFFQAHRYSFIKGNTDSAFNIGHWRHHHNLINITGSTEGAFIVATGADNIGAATELFRIKSNANTGIGTNNPLHRLHVVGGWIAGGSTTNPWTISTNGSDIFMNTGVEDSAIRLRPNGDGSATGEFLVARDYVQVNSRLGIYSPSNQRALSIVGDQNTNQRIVNITTGNSGFVSEALYFEISNSSASGIAGLFRHRGTGTSLRLDAFGTGSPLDVWNSSSRVFQIRNSGETFIARAGIKTQISENNQEIVFFKNTVSSPNNHFHFFPDIPRGTAVYTSLKWGYNSYIDAYDFYSKVGDDVHTILFGVRKNTNTTSKGVIMIGGYRLWVDSSGRLRILGGDPTSDTAGTIVGSQS